MILLRLRNLSKYLYLLRRFFLDSISRRAIVLISYRAIIINLAIILLSKVKTRLYNNITKKFKIDNKSI